MASLLDRITASCAELSKSERKVANAILQDPVLTVGETIGQLAKRSGVSEPTVHRFCKNYGANGFPEFKIALSSNLSHDNYKKVKAVENGDSVDDIVHKIVKATMYDLQNTVEKTDSTIIARVIDLISQSRRMLIVSEGLNTSSAVYMQELLLSIGLSCEIESDFTKLELRTVSMREGDLVLVFSATGEDSKTLALVRRIKEQGVSIVTLAPKESSLDDISLLNINCGQKLNAGDDLSITYIIQKIFTKILVSGVELRRSDLLLAYKDKIEGIFNKSQMHLDEIKVENRQDTSDNNDLRPDVPITTINWNS